MIYYIYKIPHILKIAYFLRIQIIGFAILLLFPVLALWVIPHLLLGLFDLSRGEDPTVTWFGWSTASLFLFTWTVLFLSLSLMITAKTILFYGGDRFGLDYRISICATSQAFNRYLFYLAVLFTIPVLILTFSITYQGEIGSGGFWTGIAAVILAFFSFLLLSAFIELLHRWVTREPKDIPSIRRFIFPFSTGIFTKWEKSQGLPVFSKVAKWAEDHFLRLPDDYLHGYTRGKDEMRRLHPEHLVNAVFFLVFFLIYLFVGTVVPAFLLLMNSYDDVFTPAIVNLFLILTAIAWTLSGIFFLFDGLRVPGFIAVACILLGIAGFFNLGDLVVGGGLRSLRAVHYYYGKNTGSGFNNRKTPYAMLANNESGGRPPFVILVAAEGGGIQAAAWTARVLTGLEVECKKLFEASGRTYDGECSRRIKLISGASGGSVGGMFVAAAYSENGLPRDEESLEKIFRDAAKSSLDSVSWGLAYPDNLRLLGIPNPSSWSRGVKLEEQWWRNASVRSGDGNVGYPLKDQWLSEWGRQKWRPSVIFNATVVETGERVLITDTRFSTDKKASGELNGHQPTFARVTEECGDVDLKVVTAARLSASFPYVTPTAKGLFEGTKPGCAAEDLHFADGGYHDNFGTASLDDWLEEAFRQIDGQALKDQKVLIIQITADAYDPDRDGRTPSLDFFLQWYSPIVTLYNNRVAAQKASSTRTMESLKRFWNYKILGEDCPVAGGPDTKIGCPIQVLNFRFKGDRAPPLSWHLTPTQRSNIEERWQEIIGETEGAQVDTELRNFRKFVCAATEGMNCS